MESGKIIYLINTCKYKPWSASLCDFHSPPRPAPEAGAETDGTE